MIFNDNDNHSHDYNSHDTDYDTDGELFELMFSCDLMIMITMMICDVYN